MFPFDLDEDDEILDTPIIVTEEETEPLPEYEIDFNTMTLTGRLISGIEAVKQWVKLCLEIPRYVYPQYPWTYGQDFEELVGKNYSVGDLKPRLYRMVTEALAENSDITGIEDFSVSKDGDKVTVNFKIQTIYGDVDYSKDIEV